MHLEFCEENQHIKSQQCNKLVSVSTDGDNGLGKIQPTKHTYKQNPR